MSVTIRDAVPDDAAGWLRLWSAYLAFYGKDLAPEISAQTWARILAPDSLLNCRVAEVDGQIAGIAVWHHHVASWSAGDTCYLEDLYVDADRRGSGIGRALIDDLRALARDRGFVSLYWHTDQTNTTARALYDSYAPADGHLRYRIPV